jgi:hypothetical protein
VIHEGIQIDPDLTRIDARGDRLSDAIRAGIMAMVKAAAGVGG